MPSAKLTYALEGIYSLVLPKASSDTFVLRFLDILFCVLH